MAKSKASSVMERFSKLKGLEHTAPLNESEVFTKSFITTDIPMLNAALSGRFDGGLTSGVTSIAGASKSFKTMFGLLMMKAYLEKYDDAIAIFYDNEFGSHAAYLEAVGIDTSRVLHAPFTNLEELNFDLVTRLDEVNRGDHVFFFIDSIGNAASKKEIEDARAGESKTDMTRAKKIKSMFRMITPYFSLKDIPLVAIQHIYMEQGMYPKAIVSGGTGIMLSSDTVWIVSKSQVKEGGDLTGYTFTITAEKSRFVKEKSKFPITVRFDHGIDPWSGLFDLGMELGYIVQPKQGWYARCKLDKTTGELKPDTKNFRRADTDSADFWKEIMADGEFYNAVKRHYQLRDDVDLVTDQSKDILSLFSNNV